MTSEYFLVWSNEHKAWWRPNCHGYSICAATAGIYSFDEAVGISWKCRDGWLKDGTVPDELVVPLDAIPEAFRPTPPTTEQTGPARTDAAEHSDGENFPVPGVGPVD